MTPPQIVEFALAPGRLVGVSCEFASALSEESDAWSVIPANWQRFTELCERYALPWGVHYGVMVPSETPGKMTYLACSRVDALLEVPGDLVAIDFEGGSYVGCEHAGPLATITETTLWFYREYLPQSGRATLDAAHVEVYDERFDPHSSTSIMTMGAPVSPAN